MNRLWVLLYLTLVGVACAQSPSTVTGTITDAGGNVATSGTVEFDIQPQGSGVHYYVAGVGTIAPQNVVCGITSTGQLVSTTVSNGVYTNTTFPCQVYANGLISPSNTTYTVLMSPNGTLTNQVALECITGTTYNLNSPVFCPSARIIPQYNTITGPQIQTNLVPNANNVYSLGNGQAYYASGYITNLFVNTCTGCVTSSSGPGVVGLYAIPSPPLDPTGATDDSGIVNGYTSTIKSGLILPPGTFYTPSLSNTNGVPFFGDGNLLRQINQTSANGSGQVVTANREQINTYAYKGRMVLGREYLVHLTSMIENNATLGNTVTPIKVILSGDSTTQGGVPIVGPPYTVDAMLTATLNDAGVAALPVINEGHSGQNSAQWLSTWLAPDLAQNPDVYVIRWGINDYPGGIVPLQTIANIRAGLAIIRAAKTVDQQTVVLEMPSSTNDNPNGRNRAFYEQLRNGFVQAAIDYQAVFVDLYGEMPDTDSYTTSMSHDYGTGSTPVIQIHPEAPKNPLYNSLLMDAIIPSGMKQFSSTNIWNISSAVGLAPSACGPQCYLEAMSLYRATDSGWPYNGMVITFMQQDGVWVQYNYPFLATYTASGAVPSAYAFRVSVTPSSGPQTWQPWSYVGGNSGVANVAAATGTAPSAGPPSDYPYAVSLFRATDSGWPYNGAVLTFEQVDGAWIQFNYPSAATGTSTYAFRISSNSSTWLGWSYVGTTSSPLTATSASFAPGALTAGSCATQSTTTVPGATTSMGSIIQPSVDPGVGLDWKGIITANAVAVRVCNFSTASVTPTPTTYNIRVIQ